MTGLTRKTHGKWFVQFRDVDGRNFISSYTKTSWSATQDSSDVMLFDYQEAYDIMEELKTHPRYQGGPDTGFYNVTIEKASDKMYSDWVGPSGELTEYLIEGNEPEDMVRLLWKYLTMEQRTQLEREAEDYLRLIEQELASNNGEEE